MGAQTIQTNDLNSILNKIDDFYICEGDKYLMSNDYNIGNKPNLELFSLIEFLDDILSSGYCSKSMKELLEKINILLMR